MPHFETPLCVLECLEAAARRLFGAVTERIETCPQMRFLGSLRLGKTGTVTAQFGEFLQSGEVPLAFSDAVFAWRR